MSRRYEEDYWVVGGRHLGWGRRRREMRGVSGSRVVGIVGVVGVVEATTEQIGVCTTQDLDPKWREL